MLSRWTSTAATLAVTATCSAQPAVGAVEFGTIDWRRDFEAARQSAKQQQLDLLMLFQEVPG